MNGPMRSFPSIRSVAQSRFSHPGFMYACLYSLTVFITGINLPGRIADSHLYDNPPRAMI